MKHIKKIYLVYVFLLLFILLFGCHKASNSNITNTRDTFQKFTTEMFLEEIQNNSISLNYTLSNPDKYGIESFAPTFGAYGLESMKLELASSENYLERLKEIDYELLSAKQQLTYDVIEHVLTKDKDLGNFLLYPEGLSPLLGIQAQLPVLLAEYNFYDKEDIVHYLELISCTYDYFNEILLYEQQKSRAGLFMSDFALDDILNQCNAFTKDKKNNLLITVFNDKVSAFPGLTKNEVKSFKDANKKAVLNKVIPAYELLSNGLNELRGTGINEGGLCKFPKGKAYYKYLVETQTGSSRSIDDLVLLLDNSMNSNIKEMQNIAQSNPEAYHEMFQVTYKLTDPCKILEYLKEAIKEDYPLLLSVNYTIKYVDESLEDYLSPAFYLTPALDNYKENSIYINQSSQFDLSSIFTTLAHEGYPGHLYQCVFFNDQSPDPIRSILDFGGYSEGWATYVELESYYLAGFDKKVATLLEKNSAAILVLYARVDIGVNYEGWTYDDTASYLENQINLTNEEVILDFYHSVIEDPANYLKYTIGYLEMLELRKKAEKSLNDKFDLKDFHEFILKVGPAPFDIIEEQLNIYLEKNS